MKTTIKVSKTTTIDGKEYAETKLVLIPAINTDEVVLFRSKDDKLYSNINFNMSCTMLKPILVSETEEILEGELMYDEEPETGLESIRKQPDSYPYLGGGYYKILALPEHFTSEQLQMIVDGKMKDGEVMVECSDKVTTKMPDNISTYFIKQPLSIHKTEESWDDIRSTPNIGETGEEIFDWLEKNYHPPKRK